VNQEYLNKIRSNWRVLLSWPLLESMLFIVIVGSEIRVIPLNLYNWKPLEVMSVEIRLGS
jgi:hypothetical protein